MQFSITRLRRKTPRHLAKPVKRRNSGRTPLVETLERRLVLSSVPGLANLDMQTDTEPQPATDVGQAIVALPTTETMVALPVSTGAVRVAVPAETTDVVVRQFIDYRLQSVVEVQADNHWLSFPSDSVHQVEIDSIASNVNVTVDPLVTKSVRVIDSQAADHAFGEDSMRVLNAEVTDDQLLEVGALDASTAALVADNPITSPNQPLAEGEGGPGGSGTPGLLAPSITSFTKQEDWGIWRFNGTVIDDKPVAGLTIDFGGVLDGQTATVDGDGNFELVIELPSGTTGTATAQTTDADGLVSNLATVVVG